MNRNTMEKHCQGVSLSGNDLSRCPKVFLAFAHYKGQSLGWGYLFEKGILRFQEKLYRSKYAVGRHLILEREPNLLDPNFTFSPPPTLPKSNQAYSGSGSLARYKARSK